MPDFSSSGGGKQWRVLQLSQSEEVDTSLVIFIAQQNKNVAIKCKLHSSSPLQKLSSLQALTTTNHYGDSCEIVFELVFSVVGGDLVCALLKV